MVLTVSFALSPGTGLSCPRRRAKPGFAQLDTSVGVSGPHDFAVRVGTGRLMRTRAPRRHRVHRIPRSTYRDDRPKRPSTRRDSADDASEFWKSQARFRKSEAARCDRMARRAVCAWRACGKLPVWAAVSTGHATPMRLHGSRGVQAAADVACGHGSAQAGRRASVSSQRTTLEQLANGISASRQSAAIDARWKSAMVSRSQATKLRPSR